MQVTIRKQKTLRALGFSTVGDNSVVSLTVGGWIEVLWFRLRYNYHFNRAVAGMGVFRATLYAWRHSDVFHVQATDGTMTEPRGQADTPLS
jgi:hypothetical protein